MPTYSNSRLNTFENCPMQFRLRYIDQVEVPPRESIEAFLGKRVHESLEWLYLNVGQGYRPTQQDLLGHFRESWQKEWTDAVHIVRAGETVAGYRLIAERCLANYHKEHDPFDRGRTVGVEMLVTYTLDAESDLQLQGYVDRLVDLGGGHYEIHDYKTSRRLPSQANVDRDRQLALYQMAVQRQFNDVRSVGLVWHYLAHNRRLESRRTPEQLRTLRDDVIALIGTIQRAIESNAFPARVSPLCSWCEYQTICPAWNPQGAGDPAFTAPRVSVDR